MLTSALRQISHTLGVEVRRGSLIVLCQVPDWGDSESDFSEDGECSAPEDFSEDGECSAPEQVALSYFCLLPFFCV